VAASHPLALGEGVPVRWLPVPDPAARTVRCRAQVADATRFQRTEGIVWDGRSVVMAATEGGLLGRGQLWRLTPGAGGAPDSLSLVLEVRDPRQLSLPDNLAVAPWGDVIVCEDNYDAVAGVTHQNLRRVTPDGRVLALARNLDNAPIGRRGAPGGEFAGACFSPDGRVLFVNLQERDVTLAITGPWPARAT
jgi:secreted PhoX family phosphatase